MDRENPGSVEADAAMIVKRMGTWQGSNEIPLGMWRDHPAGARGQPEPVARVFQRSILEHLSRAQAPRARAWAMPTIDAIMAGVADCVEKLGVNTCHQAIVRGFGVPMPLGFLVSHWSKTRKDFLCPPEAVAAILQDKRQDRFWRTSDASVMRVRPCEWNSRGRFMVAAALTERDDAIDIIEGHWLRKVPMSGEGGSPRRDPLCEYGHRGIYRILEQARHQRLVHDIMKKEVWYRRFSELH